MNKILTTEKKFAPRISSSHDIVERHDTGDLKHSYIHLKWAPLAREYAIPSAGKIRNHALREAQEPE